MPKRSFHVSAAGVALAVKDGIDWILDIDTTELVPSGGHAEYSSLPLIEACTLDRAASCLCSLY